MFIFLGAFGRTKSESVRVLLITGGHSFDAEPFYALMQSLQGITVTEVKHPNAPAMFRPENRGSYDVVLLYDMMKSIGEEEKKEYADCLKAGKGLVVWHHAYAAYPEWSEYQDIIGGRYREKAWTDKNGVSHPASTYKHDVPFKVRVADKKHPVTRGLRDFDVIDEIYINTTVNPGVHVLLTADEPSGTSAVAWTNRYGKSKVATILLGHDHQTWTNPAFIKLLTQAILWAKP